MSYHQQLGSGFQIELPELDLPRLPSGPSGPDLRSAEGATVRPAASSSRWRTPAQQEQPTQEPFLTPAIVTPPPSSISSTTLLIAAAIVGGAFLVMR